MANWTAAELRNAALRKLGILGQAQTANADNAKLADDAWTSLHPQLRKDGLAPFTSAAVPEWAQQPCSKIVAGEIAEEFGKSIPEAESLKNRGMRELAKQVSMDKEPVPVRVKSFL